jgi:predicted AlkP superfamily pyrophosphatase or phosphodiesterase
MMNTALRILGCAALALHMLSTSRPAAAAAQTPRNPKLLVVVVVDQMRAQYLDDYRQLFTKGFNRLLTEGASFTRAAYPYLNTVTCAGHSTIGTGTFPYRHGMVLNAWYDRATKKSPTCTSDPAATEFSYSGLKPVEGDSASRLMQRTLAERIKSERGGRVVALSLKPRSTVPVAGSAADAVVWFDDRGGWMTSLAYGPPAPALQAFIAANPPARDLRKVWQKSLPRRAYRFGDKARDERPVVGWGRTFPHPLSRRRGKADAGFYSRWQRSPYSDEYLGRMAAAMIDAMKLGRGDGVDFLSVSFSALDLVGHAYGPRSHEVQDLLVRLDATLGRLLEHLDTTVGRGNYVLGLSADHGVSDIPEQTNDGGRLTNATIKAALQKALAGPLGPGEHVVANQYTDHYLSPAAAERIRTDPQLRAAAIEAVRALPGVAQVYYGPDLANADARQSSDPMLRAAALSYYPGRSGDLILLPRAHWITSTAATTHGTQNPYDQRVPVVVFGAGIKAGSYDAPATPADIVPTLGAAAGVEMAGVDGRVLTEAMTGGSR